MLDDAIRIVFLILLGFALTFAVVWYIRFLYQEIRGTGQVVIDPLTVITGEGRGDDELGKAVAQMLQARIQSLFQELRDAQESFTTNIRGSAVVQSVRSAPIADVRILTRAVTFETSLLQPVDMKLSVAGVDVGGMLPWLQRRLSSRRTLHFTLYLQPSKAQIFGSLAALGVSDVGLRLSVEGQDGKAPALDTVVDRLAHEIVHRYLGRDRSNKLEVLTSSEFTVLSDVLVSVAQANRDFINGRPDVQKEFETLIPPITSLADRVPDWPELGYLAAKIADSGRDSNTARKYYSLVQMTFEHNGQSEVVRWITKRMAELGSPLQGTATAAPVKVPLPTKVDYSSEIKSVRDSGEEGSVVGQALATALEFQIAKTTGKWQPMSARYIYYAARKLTGSAKFDSGAAIKDGITVLSDDGTVAEDVWPYRPGEFAKPPPANVNQATRFRIAHAKELTTLDELKRALDQDGPVVTGISMFDGAMASSVAKSGLIPLPTKKQVLVGGHAIVVVGYDDNARLLKFVNSWGKNWGENGYGYLPYDYFTKYGSDAWTFGFATAN